MSDGSRTEPKRLRRRRALSDRRALDGEGLGAAEGFDQFFALGLVSGRLFVGEFLVFEGLILDVFAVAQSRAAILRETNGTTDRPQSSEREQ